MASIYNLAMCPSQRKSYYETSLPPVISPNIILHRCRSGQVIPATRTNFWQTKRRGNVLRDKRNLKKLRLAGWQILIVWECHTRNPQKLSAKLLKFLAA
jgi:G:T-mismatch repair DNA endonuclease (very short patch repair protein)